VKSFACGDVVPDCPAVFSGPDFEDLLRQVADHAREIHGLTSLPPDLVTEVRRSIRDINGPARPAR
jgi:predicted small metal-binding protein